MYTRYWTETILTSMILVSRVWSRPSDVQCEGQRGEGAKWFDGCQWCICQHGRSVCSSSGCSVIVSQLPACHNTGASWSDGCYSCKCDLKTIECTPDKACLQLLHTDRFGAGAMQGGACVQPTDQRCICGIDGVPSCTAEVIDRDSLPAVTVELNPLLRSSLSLSSPDSDRDLKPVNSTTPKHQPGVTGTRFGKTEGHLVATDKEFVKLTYDSERNENLLNRQVLASQNGGPSVLESGYSAESRHTTAYEDEAAFLLVVSANSCRWGQRWYGGSLRCSCGKDNSITCGDPGFVASRIDGFRLATGECVEGHTWEDKDSCAVCTCRISGLAFCSRSPSCHLPFIIKTLPLDTDANINFEIVKRDQNLKEKSEFTGEIEHNFIWNKRADTIFGERSSSTVKDLTLDKTNKATGDFEIAKSDINVDLQKNPIEKSTIHSDDDVDGSGDSNFSAKTTTWAENDDMQTSDIQVNTASNHRAIPITEEESTQTVAIPNSSLYDSLIFDKRAATGRCTPKSTWVEFGCNRCVCNSQGEKHCNPSRCRSSTAASTTADTTNGVTTTNCIGLNPRCRPMVRPPPEFVWNRTQPIDLSKPSWLLDCGRYKLGDRYWDNCNLCECTTSGPRCTAKSCGSQMGR